MKTDPVAPLAGVTCCQHVTEHHCPSAGGGIGVLQPGDVLDDRFVITEVISRSGMAMIFKAQDLHDGNADVAIKVPHKEFENDPDFLARFKGEEEIGLKLNHPYVVRFIPVTTPRSRPYIVTEYLRGCTLGHLMEALLPLPEVDALKIASLLCEALQYLHENGITHRDLKPHNVMIGCNGTLRLLDFGLATAKAAGRVPSAGGEPVMGTPDYMAPEQVKGKRGDSRTDIYCLGAMLYEMLTGSVPFEADNPLCAMNARVLGDPEPLRNLNPAISPSAEEIVLHAMERDPAKRHRSARALREELDDPVAVPVSGRCERGEKTEASKTGFARYRTVILAFISPAVALAAVAFSVWLRTGAH
jgi:serine/threonine-protein kinase